MFLSIFEHTFKVRECRFYAVTVCSASAFWMVDDSAPAVHHRIYDLSFVNSVVLVIVISANSGELVYHSSTVIYLKALALVGESHARKSDIKGIRVRFANHVFLDLQKSNMSNLFKSILNLFTFRLLAPVIILLAKAWYRLEQLCHRLIGSFW